MQRTEIKSLPPYPFLLTKTPLPLPPPPPPPPPRQKKPFRATWNSGIDKLVILACDNLGVTYP